MHDFSDCSFNMELLHVCCLLNKHTQIKCDRGKYTCLKNVIGFCPMAWASPILALMTSVNGLLPPYKRGTQDCQKQGRYVC